MGYRDRYLCHDDEVGNLKKTRRKIGKSDRANKEPATWRRGP
jgi:hypothetical protein